MNTPRTTRPKRPKVPCLACGRTIACEGIMAGGKGRLKHKCPHGKPCLAGISNQGWNPGGGMHDIYNPCCSGIAKRAYPFARAGRSWDEAFQKAVMSPDA